MIHVGSITGLVVPESSSGVDAGIPVTAGDLIDLTATGEIYAGVFLTGRNGPAGWNWIDNDSKFPLPGSHPYALIVSVGGGPYEYVGASRRLTARRDGALTFRTNDDKPGPPGSGEFFVSGEIWRPESEDIPDCRVTTAPSATCLAQRDRAMALRDEAIGRCRERQEASARLGISTVGLVVAWMAFLLVLIAIAIVAATAAAAAGALAHTQQVVASLAAGGGLTASAAAAIAAGVGASAAGVQSPALWWLLVAAAVLLILALATTHEHARARAQVDDAEVRYQSAARAFRDGVDAVRRYCCDYPPMFDPELPACG